MGEHIAGLRKAMGVKQEDVAKAVGVSAQAVSKWENGGLPDTELLPAIADYFGVGIDRLFGRVGADYNKIEEAVTRYIAQPLDECDMDLNDLPTEAYAASMERARKIGWAVNMGLFSTRVFDKIGIQAKQMFDDIQQNAGEDMHLYAKIISDAGISLMSLSKDFPYFMLYPTPLEGLHFGAADLAAYQKIFAAFGEPDVLRALHFIHTREAEKKFSLGHFAKKMGFDTAHAAQLLARLTDMKYVETNVLELDDTPQTFYTVLHNPLFIMFLLLMETYTKPPKAKLGMDNRTRPYIRAEEDTL